jgi:hypothetical protein
MSPSRSKALAWADDGCRFAIFEIGRRFSEALAQPVDDAAGEQKVELARLEVVA